MYTGRNYWTHFALRIHCKYIVDLKIWVQIKCPTNVSAGAIVAYVSSMSPPDPQANALGDWLYPTRPKFPKFEFCKSFNNSRDPIFFFVSTTLL